MESVLNQNLKSVSAKLNTPEPSRYDDKDIFDI